MLDRVELVKRKLDEAMEQLCQVSWMLSKQPGKDFSRTKKLPFSKVISILYRKRWYLANIKLDMFISILCVNICRNLKCIYDCKKYPAKL